MLILLNLLSAMALLVWSTHIVGTGIMRLQGTDLRRVLSRSINATRLLVTAFVARNLASLMPALAVIPGADAGTALMARSLTFTLAWRSPLLIFFAVMLFISRRQMRNVMPDALLGPVFTMISYSRLAALLITATRTVTGVISFRVARGLMVGSTSVAAGWRRSTP